MKKFICFIIILTITISVAFAGGGGDRRASGKITIYTSMYANVIEDIQRILAREFPNVQIEFVYGRTGTLQAKIAQEIAAGRLGCDILMVADPSYSLELKEKGMLHSYISKEASNLAFDYDPDGYWYPVRVSNMVLAFNPQRHSRNTLPNSFLDFANDTRLRGNISMGSPLTSGTTLAAVTALKDKYGYEYFDALGRQNIHIEYANANSIARLESGECRVIMILEESILQSRRRGSQLEVVYPSDGTIVVPSNIMIVNDRWSANRNTATAQVITDWFLSEEGQKAIVSGCMHSVRKDFNIIPHDSIPTSEILANSIPVNWENILNHRDETRYRFEQALTLRR